MLILAITKGTNIVSNLDLSKLNKAQQIALKQTEGAVMVLAGAGSGKTRVTTYRVAYLIEEMGVLPENILAITFTNKATNEMRTRLINLLGEDVAKDIWISTFHSMCVRILRSHISNLKTDETNVNYNGNFSIYTDSDRDRALKTVIKNLNLDPQDYLQKASYNISRAKNSHLSPWEYQKQNGDLVDIEYITKIYSAYQNYLAENNALDFDDLLFKTYDLFKKFPNVLERYQNRFMFIHVDEFQDTNTIQYQLVKMLAGKYKNLFVVGDEDQCIYSWRGASIANISSFKKDFPDCKILKLEQNYRSTKLILGLANLLIKNNAMRNDKTLWTENSLGEKVDYYVAKDEFDEAEYVARKIRDLKEQGYNYRDFAILTRLNAMTAPFEEKFLNYNIPYRVFAGKKFFDRLEIKNILAYLKMLTNPYDSTSFERIVNFPKRGIGEATIKTILDLASFHGVTPYTIILNDDEYLIDNKIIKKIQPFKAILQKLLDLLGSVSPMEFIKQMVKIAGFYEEYSSNSEEDMSRLVNIDTFLSIANQFFNTNKDGDISDFLQSITLTSDIDEYDDKDNAVTIATVHAVKGLEFKIVFIVGLEERMFPILRASSSTSDMEEERRLMFVAITRAEERLFLTRSKSRFMYGKRDYLMPSRFLAECNVEENNTNFGNREYVKNTSSFSSFAKQRFNLGNAPVSQKEVDLTNKFAVGNKVTHPKFGSGVIVSNTGIALTKCVTIDFDEVGKKTLSVEYAPITVVG